MSQEVIYVGSQSPAKDAESKEEASLTVPERKRTNSSSNEGETESNKKLKVAVEHKIEVFFDPYGVEPRTDLGTVAYQASSWVHRLSDPQYRLLTAILGSAIDKLLKKSKLSTGASGQMKIAQDNLPALPLPGSATTNAVSDLLAVELKNNQLDPTFGIDATGDFRFQVVRYFLSRFSTISKE